MEFFVKDEVKLKNSDWSMSGIVDGFDYWGNVIVKWQNGYCGHYKEFDLQKVWVEKYIEEKNKNDR